MPAGAGMKIKTNSPVVLKAREGVMEFLLANHPLDWYLLFMFAWLRRAP